MRSKKLKQFKCKCSSCITVRLRNNLGVSMRPVWELGGLVCIIGNGLHLDCCLVPPGGGCVTYLCRVTDVSESCGLQLLRIVAVILGISQLVMPILSSWSGEIQLGESWECGNSPALWHFPAEASLLKLPSLEKNFGHPLEELAWLGRSKGILLIAVYLCIQGTDRWAITEFTIIMVFLDSMSWGFFHICT